MFDRRRWMFTVMYLRGLTLWDTGVTPPELRDVVEGPGTLLPGRALDIGCGSGTNSLYLAQRGWEVVGVDFAGPAISRANAKLDRTREVTTKNLRVRFVRGDATHLRELGAQGPYTLIYDIGCLHGIPQERRQAYAAEVTALAAPGAVYLLYAFEPTATNTMGLSPAEVDRLFGRAFTRVKRVAGSDRGARSSAWYVFTRSSEQT
jgi:SAM-dependent methyltransferase